MNDPGLDKPIGDDADDVENQNKDQADAEEEDEEAYLQPSSWWLASTAFPLIAGTFGPMASAFSICALVVHWRVNIPPGAAEQNGIPIDDPKWLIGINAAQLAIALISNFFLLMNMAKRVRFGIAQPITIIGWYISSFVLIGLCACASGPLVLEPRESHAFSQAFYYAIFAAGLYFLVATLMVGTVYGAYRGYYEKDFQLTMSQRTLMLQTISFLVYLLLGATIYSHIEGWLFLDAVYWADFTLLTVGIGDYAPVTHTGRSLLFPFAIGGIIILGLVIGSIRSLVLERGKEKMEARMVERQRRRLIKKVDKKTGGELLEPISENGATHGPSDSSENIHKMSERDRRQTEFHLMRRIQRRAHLRQSWSSLFIWGGIALALWFIGAAVFQACEYGQDWSYFGSLYFSYTSLLTIGYGDFSPQSNSGKPFFVFWSLLSVPSLTILISKMGDTVVREVKDLTLWIANFTILPGEKGVRNSMKEAAKKVTAGGMFSGKGNLLEPPGILGEMGGDDSTDDEGEAKDDPESGAQRVNKDRATREQKRAKKRIKKDYELPDEKIDYHILLVKEIAKVMKHLRSSPPRKYEYEEWAWYLKLIGEDEGSAESHRKPNIDPKSEGNGMGTGVGRKGGREGNENGANADTEKWSWIGERSPLMGGKEEAEWILERLVRMLEWELEKSKKRDLEGRESMEKVSTEYLIKKRSDNGEGSSSSEQEKISSSS